MTEIIIDHNILTNILTAFTQTASLGYVYLQADAMRLIRFFIIIEVALFGMMMAFGKSDLGSEAIKKLFFIAIYLWLIPNMHMVSNIIINNFTTAGLTAGGSVITTVEIFDPSAIVGMGFDATKPIFDESGYSLNPFSTMMKGLAAILIILSFIYIAWQLFLSIIEFYIITVLSVILLPFALFKPLAFISEKTISATFALAIRLMIMSFIISLSYKTLETLRLPPEASFVNCMGVFVAAGTIAYLCKSALGLSSVYFGGGGGIGSSGLMGAAVGMAMARSQSAPTPNPDKPGLGKRTLNASVGAAKNGIEKMRAATGAHIQNRALSKAYPKKGNK